MNFIFESWKQYFMNEQSECVKYIYFFTTRKIKFISSSYWVIFFLLCNYIQKCFPFFFLTPSTNFIMNCCSLAAGISRSSLLLPSFVRNLLNNFKSYKVFVFVLTFSCSSEEDFMSASDNFMHLLLITFLLAFGKHCTNNSLSGKWRHWDPH